MQGKKSDFGWPRDGFKLLFEFQRCPCRYVVPDAMKVGGYCLKYEISVYLHSEQIFNTESFFSKIE